MTIVDFYKTVIDQDWIAAGDDGHYSIQQVGDTVYVYFEQTPNIKGWELNFDFPAIPYKEERGEIWFAHAGFVKIWKSIRAEIIDKIKFLNPKKIIVSGYSQGAAITVLAFEDLQNEFGYIVEGISFAAPRVIWFPTFKMRKRFRNLTMYKNKWDFIPDVPFRWMGFSHVEHIIKIGNPLPKLPDLLKGFFSALFSFNISTFGFYIFNRHMPNKYINALSARI